MTKNDFICAFGFSENTKKDCLSLNLKSSRTIEVYSLECNRGNVFMTDNKNKNSVLHIKPILLHCTEIDGLITQRKIEAIISIFDY